MSDKQREILEKDREDELTEEADGEEDWAADEEQEDGIGIAGVNVVSTEPILDRTKRLIKKAESGDPEAQDRLGDCYKHGYGMEKDWAKAVEWYRKSAAQGNAAAQRSLGYCYDYGEGIEQDKENAVYWYKKAAEGGDVDAIRNLGNCYYFATGVEQDFDKAAYWYGKAAEEGHPDAENSLGFCYQLGRGVPQDFASGIGKPPATEMPRRCLTWGSAIPMEKAWNKTMRQLWNIFGRQPKRAGPAPNTIWGYAMRPAWE